MTIIEVAFVANTLARLVSAGATLSTLIRRRRRGRRRRHRR